MLRSATVLCMLLLATSSVLADSEKGFKPIFDGKSFDGWEGNMKMFRIEDGAIVGGTLKAPIPHNEFLCTTKKYGDFELRLQFKLLGVIVNGGIQIRSHRIPNEHEVSGYQADIADQWWGSLFDESRRNKALVKADQAAIAQILKHDDWNDYIIRCEGKRIQLWINGLQTVDYTELDDSIEQHGIIGLQIHESGPSEAHYRNIRIKELNSAGTVQFPRDELDDTGFVSIFDGRTLSGFHVSTATGHSRASGNKSGGRWVVEDGAIIGSQDVPGNGGMLITDKQYDDFEVVVEMNNDFGPDSGLFLRSNEKGQAYQYLIDYHDAGSLAGLYGEGLPGDLNIRNFDFGPDPQTIRPHEASFPLPIQPRDWPRFWKHGKWNQLRARIEGNPPKFTTWINGVRFMELQDNERRHPDNGGIALQVHGGGDFTKKYVRYRGMKLKELQNSK